MKSSVKIKKMVLCAIFSAISIVILWLGGLLGDLDLTIAAVTSFVVVIAAIEMGLSYAFAVYLVTSALAALLLPSYFITPCYILFVGYYPIVKALLDRRPKLIRILCKLLLVNAMFMVLYYLEVKFFGVEAEMFGMGKEAVFFLTLALVNVAFLLFDYALGLLITLYYKRFRKMLGIQKLLK